jgi:hypothetical protein
MFKGLDDNLRKATNPRKQDGSTAAEFRECSAAHPAARSVRRLARCGKLPANMIGRESSLPVRRRRPYQQTPRGVHSPPVDPSPVFLPIAREESRWGPGRLSPLRLPEPHRGSGTSIEEARDGDRLLSSMALYWRCEGQVSKALRPTRASCRLHEACTLRDLDGIDGQDAGRQRPPVGIYVGPAEDRRR